LSHNSLDLGHSGMGLAGHGALWVNPELLKLDPGLCRGDDCSGYVPNVVIIVGLLIIEAICLKYKEKYYE
jgi:hypothetical protein